MTGQQPKQRNRHHAWRIVPILLAVLVLFSFLTASCRPGSDEPSKVGATIRIAALNGPTGIGLVPLAEWSKDGTTLNHYHLQLVSTPDEIVALLSNGGADVAALPTNLAAVLYARTKGDIRLINVNTLGVLYVLTADPGIGKLADLEGKTLYATGQGSVVEYVLDDLLNRALPNAKPQIQYLGEHAELATRAASGIADPVVLPEPFATQVLRNNPAMRRAVDLTAAWKEFHPGAEGGDLTMGCMVSPSSYIDKNTAALRAFNADYRKAADWVNANPKDAGTLAAQWKILPDAAWITDAIPNCHIVFRGGADARASLNPFYRVLLAGNPKSIGGALPDDAFYWSP